MIANTNFPFLSTLGKPETQTLGGFRGSGCIFGELEAFFSFFIGRHQFSISINTWKTGDPNFKWGQVIGTFLGHGELEPYFSFFIMADTNFPFLSTLEKPETQTLGGVGNCDFCSRTHFWGVRGTFLIFHNGQHQFSISINTSKNRRPKL